MAEAPVPAPVAVLSSVPSAPAPLPSKRIRLNQPSGRFPSKPSVVPPTTATSSQAAPSASSADDAYLLAEERPAAAQLLGTTASASPLAVTTEVRLSCRRSCSSLWSFLSVCLHQQGISLFDFQVFHLEASFEVSAINQYPMDLPSLRFGPLLDAGRMLSGTLSLPSCRDVERCPLATECGRSLVLLG